MAFPLLKGLSGKVISSSTYLHYTDRDRDGYRFRHKCIIRPQQGIRSMKMKGKPVSGEW